MINICSIYAGIALMAYACTPQVLPSQKEEQATGKEFFSIWDFEEMSDFKFSSNSEDLSYSLDNGNLFLNSRADRKDLSSIESLRGDFLSGDYEWRVYIPNIQAGDQLSFDCGLRSEGGAELSFSVSYGLQQLREDFELSSDELLLCVGSGAKPYSLSYSAIYPGWHNLHLKLKEKDSKYKAVWTLDEQDLFSISLDYGPKERAFSIFSSFGYNPSGGDFVPRKDYQCRIDYIKAEAYVLDSLPEESVTKELSFGISGKVPLGDGLTFSLFSKGKNYPFTSKDSRISGEAEEDSEYWALYPYDASASISKIGINSCLSAEIKAYKTVDECQYLSIAKAESDSFCFDDLMSRMQICLNESLTEVSEIIISDPSGRSLEGSLTLDLNDFNLYTKALSDACIHLKPSEGQFFTNGIPYYFSILSGKYAQGLELQFMRGEDKIGTVLLPALELSAGECSEMIVLSIEEEWEEIRWDFENNINGWYYYTHNPSSGECYKLENGCVKIWTNANSMDRNKLHTIRENFGEGIYTFRTYVSEIAAGEKCSIGAFIYADDSHEMDFEIGYGKAAARKACGAAENEMVACMTSQDLPFNSTYTPISVGWHTLVLKLDVVGGKYRMTWLIDDVKIKELDLRYGPEIKFLISVSVENLEFMGDFQPTHENYGLFDYVSYKRKL